VSWENSALFIMCLGQFLITAVVFNKGPPHRRPLWTNMYLLAAMAVQTVFVLWVLLSPGDPMTKVFAGTIPFPDVAFRLKLLALLGLNAAAAALADQLANYGFAALRGRRCCGLTMF
jgi:cation-transporting ATPase 13A2